MNFGRIKVSSMAAKLCLECGGSGKTILFSCNFFPKELFGDVPISVMCENCKGLGYIPISQSK